MSISTEPTPLSFNGDDSTVAFAITWKYFVKGDVVATLRDSAGAETVWVLDTDYTLTAAGVDAGGTLTATTAPATGETLVLTLEPSNVQASSFPIGGPFPSSTVEQELDLAAQRDAKIENFQLRVLRVPKTDTRSGSQLELPNETDRKSKFMAFDANGDPIASVGSSDSLGPVTAFMNTLLDDTTAAIARQTLGIGSGGTQILPPDDGTAAAPGFAFGDGDSGFYESVDDQVFLTLAGTASIWFTTLNAKSNTVDSWFLPHEAASALNPTLCPSNNDNNTGIGLQAADNLSLVAGGLEAVRAEDPADLADDIEPP